MPSMYFARYSNQFPMSGDVMKMMGLPGLSDESQPNSDQTLAWTLRSITMIAVTAAGVTPETRET
jgi:hypothetical protein